MDLNLVARFALLSFMVLMISLQCSQESDDPAADKCDCQTASIAEEKKDVEAVVVLITSYQDPDRFYVLSTEPKDFSTASHTGGRNILVPCDSLPAQYQEAGTLLLVSYRRKDCYGALTSPNLRSFYGYYVDLTSTRIKP